MVRSDGGLWHGVDFNGMLPDMWSMDIWYVMWTGGMSVDRMLSCFFDVNPDGTVGCRELVPYSVRPGFGWHGYAARHTTKIAGLCGGEHVLVMMREEGPPRPTACRMFMLLTVDELTDLFDFLNI